MAERSDLHEILCSILGSRHVYYQPPEKFKMVYPAIVYERNRSWDMYADGSSYIRRKGYIITLIDHNPDSLFFDKLKDLQYCHHDRHFVVDNLYHDVFTIYY